MPFDAEVSVNFFQLQISQPAVKLWPGKEPNYSFQSARTGQTATGKTKLLGKNYFSGQCFTVCYDYLGYDCTVNCKDSEYLSIIRIFAEKWVTIWNSLFISSFSYLFSQTIQGISILKEHLRHIIVVVVVSTLSPHKKVTGNYSTHSLPQWYCKKIFVKNIQYDHQ